MGSLLKGIVKHLNNPYATIAVDGIIGGDVLGYVDSGNYILNALISGKMLGGGFPRGKVVALAGDKGTGKTFVLTKAMKSFLDADPENEIALFESEGAITKDMLIKRGIDVSRVSVIPVSTVEELRTQALNLLDYVEDQTPKGEFSKLMLALDSLGMLSTEHEIATATSGDNKADMGKRAQLIKSVFRTITLKLGIMQIPMIITNHTYSTMDNRGKQMGGGTGLEFAASIIIFLSKSKVKEGEEAETGADKLKTQVGNNVAFHVEKGRFTIEGSRAIIQINFKTGISRYGGMLGELIKAGIVKKSGSWLSYNGTNIAQGEKQFYAKAKEFITDEILQSLVPYITEKYMYGVDPSVEEAADE